MNAGPLGHSYLTAEYLRPDVIERGAHELAAIAFARFDVGYDVPRSNAPKLRCVGLRVNTSAKD